MSFSISFSPPPLCSALSPRPGPLCHARLLSPQQTLSTCLALSYSVVSRHVSIWFAASSSCPISYAPRTQMEVTQETFRADNIFLHLSSFLLAHQPICFQAGHFNRVLFVFFTSLFVYTSLLILGPFFFNLILNIPIIFCLSITFIAIAYPIYQPIYIYLSCFSLLLCTCGGSAVKSAHELIPSRQKALSMSVTSTGPRKLKWDLLPSR